MKKILLLSLIFPALIAIVHAEGIVFPVVELENCASKEECRVYCDSADHMDACIKFAETHGLMNKPEAERARKFKDTIIKSGGPGRCDSPSECKSFCSATANLEECLEFAKKQNIKDKFVEEGGKILKYVKSGGAMPGGCDSKESCMDYCKDFSHAEECFAFGKAAGINRDTENIEKFIEVAKKGDTPGGCKNKEECESYCADDAHRDACIEFAVRTGILNKTAAENIKNSGKTGPGGCTSFATCGMYCDYPGHREECVRFAEEHGYMTKDESKNSGESMVSLRAGVERVPDEVRECLKFNLGENILNNIQSGNLVPGPGIGLQVKSCFEKFGKAGNPAEFLKNAPAPVAVCVKEKLGVSLETLKLRTSNFTPEMADTVRVCFQRNEIQKVSDERPALRDFLRTAPPDIVPCIRETLGSDFEKIISGVNIPVDTAKIKICFDRFQPSEPVTAPAQTMPAEPILQKPTPTAVPPSINLSVYPPEVVLCIKTRIGNNVDYFLAQPDAVLKFEIIVKECANSIQLVPPPEPLPPSPTATPIPTPTPTPTPTPLITITPAPSDTINNTICIQVITPAKDPLTGACKLFATPCDVPAGWILTDKCESTNSYIYPTSYVKPSFSIANVFYSVFAIFGLVLE